MYVTVYDRYEPKSSGSGLSNISFLSDTFGENVIHITNSHFIISILFYNYLVIIIV